MTTTGGTPSTDVVAAAVPRRRLGSRVRVLSGMTLVAGPRGASELDGTAAFVWRQIDGRRTVEQLAGALCAEYEGVDLPTALADVTELICELLGCEVVELTAPGG